MAKTILIVEDDKLSQDLYGDLLQAEGYDTLLAKDGLEGLKLARDHQPDLILMDFLLPELSGLKVTKMIKEDEILSGIPVIAMTAFAFDGDEQTFREVGCVGYITKPISNPVLLKMVAKFLD